MQLQQNTRRQAQGWRTRLVVATPQQVHVNCNQTPYRHFASNDYLGLANHSSLKKAVQDGVAEYGVGSGASPMIIGHFSPHHRAEKLFAEFLERDRAILFNNGYTANIGALSALLQRGDHIYQDKLNHASLIDGALLSRATLKRYAHLDMQHLNSLLQQPTTGAQFIASDSVFSMDGDLAPLTELALAAAQHHCGLLIDEAHSIGLFGAEGRGLVHAQGLTQQQVPVLVCPLGKAFGSFGAIVAGPEIYIEHILQFARSYTYSTALPPSLALSALTSLQLIRKEAWRREKLWELIALFQQTAAELDLAFTVSHSPIQILKIGDAQQTLAIAEALKSEGFLVGVIRPPTVASGACRLRISLSASHNPEDINDLLLSLRRALDEKSQ